MDHRLERDKLLAQEIVDLLNELHILDPIALQLLITGRVPCMLVVADHPTVIVKHIAMDGECDRVKIGMLGILNGLLSRLAIVTGTDETGRICGFEIRTRNVLTRKDEHGKDH